jgi:uncharacterized protein
VSEANVTLVQGWFEAFNRRDIEAVLAAFSPDARMATLTSSKLWGGAYQGHDGIREYFDSFAEVWDEMRLFPEEFRDLGDTVVVTGHWRSRGRGSGAEVETPSTWVFTIADGRITASRVFRDTDEALRELGLAG